MTSAMITDLFPERRRAVENARVVIRMPDASDDELHDACVVLFAWGDWADRTTATEFRRAMAHDAEPAAEAIAAGQRHQRRLYIALAATMAASFLFGWAINEAFTAINAARIAGGW